MQKLDENFSYILCKLDNVQCALSTYSQSVIADPMPPDVDSSYDDNGDLALSFDESSPVFEDLVLLSDLLFDLNDGTLEEVTGGTLEEVSGISTYKVELDPTKRSLSLYRFPPAQFKLEFPFDPGFGMLTTFLGSANCYSFVVLDEFKEIIKIFVSHFDSTISDQYTLDQFPYDPSANVFIVTSSGSLQVHQLHPVIFVFNLLLVMDTFQLFGSVFYIRPTVKLAKPLIDNESVISIWDPGITSKFWAIAGSRHSVEVLRVFEAIKNNWSCLFAKLSNWEQLSGVEMGVETFNAMYFDRCLWVTEHIGDHLDYSCMEYKCGIPVKEFHTCNDKTPMDDQEHCDGSLVPYELFSNV
ncbi:hypothetical protein RDI58_029798 [Solanum bulbocastanum]|uniref:Uncharacterized protein n=1 Tax=Solanum bulbocastanum TaxID=147425 RepID=A0AAN8SVA4_SOLBU